jgi:hypothetical protein
MVSEVSIKSIVNCLCCSWPFDDEEPCCLSHGSQEEERGRERERQREREIEASTWYIFPALTPVI